ncbi:MAG: acetate kinase [Clostridia bacterium]|nr:acetate kinase [Clostridia bacterium]
MKILVLNCGSSSVKYQVIETTTKEKFVDDDIQRVTDHAAAIQEILSKVDLSEIKAVGHRVVHGGENFQHSVVVDDAVLAEMDRIEFLAPLHNPAAMAGVRACREQMPDLPNILVFDTAFHSTMEPGAYLYGVPYEDYEKYGIRKYGFHGTSHQYVAMQAAEQLGRPLSELKLVTCHIGNGASVCAVQNGKCIDTSMGMTPLAGLVMGTRAGDIDAAALSIICKEHNFTIDEAITYLNKSCGLKGLSGISSDMRDLEPAMETNERVKIALDVFIHRLVQYVGAYVAQMKGCDAVVWTGGIGVHRKFVSERVMEYFDFLPNCKKLIIPTNEELMIALECEKLLQKK